MAKGRNPTKKTNRPSMAQLVFIVLTVVIVLSFVLSLFVKL